MNIRFSRTLALILGILTPLLETIRRWHTRWENPPAFFDDYMIGGLLLYGAWRVGRDKQKGQKFLAAGWGFMSGLAYASFFLQLEAIRLGQTDPAPVSSEWVAVVKGVGLALAVLGLITSLRKLPIENNG